MKGVRAELLHRLDALHAAVDAAAAQAAAELGERLRCRRGCSGCCSDGLRVFEVEAERIRVDAAALLASGDAHAPGACAFLDAEGACRIYAQRPYVCRSQGLPLRWFDRGPQGEPLELRDICPLNEPGEPALAELPDSACWLLGPWEARLHELARAWDGGERVALRDLFARASEPVDPG